MLWMDGWMLWEWPVNRRRGASEVSSQIWRKDETRVLKKSETQDFTRIMRSVQKEYFHLNDSFSGKSEEVVF